MQFSLIIRLSFPLGLVANILRPVLVYAPGFGNGCLVSPVSFSGFQIPPFWHVPWYLVQTQKVPFTTFTQKTRVLVPCETIRQVVFVSYTCYTGFVAGWLCTSHTEATAEASGWRSSVGIWWPGTRMCRWSTVSFFYLTDTHLSDSKTVNTKNLERSRPIVVSDSSQWFEWSVEKYQSWLVFC